MASPLFIPVISASSLLLRRSRFLYSGRSREGFVVKLAFDQDKAVIQARKGGVFRTMLEMDRSFTTIFQRKNGHVEMNMGVAKTLDSLDNGNIKNIYHGIFIEIPEAIWAYEIEHHLWNAIEMYLENQ